MKILCFSFLWICISIQLAAQIYQPTWESLDKRPVPQWYKDGKFGIFIHWGVYSVPGYCSKGNYAEWYQNGLVNGDTARLRYHKEKFGNRTYYDLAGDFKAELFNPDQWAQVFEKSGAKYIVLTSKHHDGFCLWPSKDANRDWGFPWNAVDAGPHRDLLGDLFAAVRKTGVHAGMYYSLYEWYNPLWLKNKKQYADTHMWPQMKELINTYKPDVFWTDGDWEASDSLWRSTEFLSWLYNESPVKNSVVTYDRWGIGVRFHHGLVYTPEYQPDVDFKDHYWEESRGMGFSYGYNREEDAWDYNSAQSLVLQLIDKVSGGGNFLLDIGPDEHGKIPPIMQERLLQIGSWMKINSEAIYGSQRWRATSQWSQGRKDYKPKNGGGDILLKLTIDPDPEYAVKECFFTYNAAQNNLYALLPQYPSARKFVINDLPLKADTKIELLETHETLSWQQKGNDVEIQFPPFDPNKIKSQYAFVVKIYNTGAFASNTKVDVEYPEHSMKPIATLWSANGTEIRYTLDGSAPTEKSTLYASPLTVDKSVTLSARAFGGNVLPGNIATVPLSVYEWKQAVNPGEVMRGIRVKKYLLEAPGLVSDIEKVSPAATGISLFISIGDTLRRENTGLIYEGFIKIPADGFYNFYLSSDDGSKLWIGDELVIDYDGLHGDDEKSGKIALKKGYHSIKLAYFQAGGGSGLRLKYNIGNHPKMELPASWFYFKK
jgi:alpha-L-fucosidase